MKFFIPKWMCLVSVVAILSFGQNSTIEATEFVFVTNFVDDSITKYDLSGNLLGTLTLPGELDGSAGGAIGPDGNLYVSSFLNSNIVVVDPISFTRVDVISVGSTSSNVLDVGFRSNGDMLVAKFAQQRVERWDVQTKTQLDPGAFGDLQGLTGLDEIFSQDGKIYVGLRNGNGIGVYNDSDGSEITTFGGAFFPSAAEGVILGTDLNGDQIQDIYAASVSFDGSANDAIHVFSGSDFSLITSNLITGLNTPLGINFLPNGDLLAVEHRNGGNGRVLRFDGTTVSDFTTGLNQPNDVIVFSSAVVPEPSSLLLLLLGGILMGNVFSRQKQNT